MQVKRQRNFTEHLKPTLHHPMSIHTQRRSPCHFLTSVVRYGQTILFNREREQSTGDPMPSTTHAQPLTCRRQHVRSEGMTLIEIMIVIIIIAMIASGVAVALLPQLERARIRTTERMHKRFVQRSLYISKTILVNVLQWRTLSTNVTSLEASAPWTHGTFPLRSLVKLAMSS